MFAETIGKEEWDVVCKVMDKASALFPNYKRITMGLDLLNAHDDVGIDFSRLLAFDNMDFIHDIMGIRNNMNRETGKLENCFLPRCAKTGA